VARPPKFDHTSLKKNRCNNRKLQKTCSVFSTHLGYLFLSIVLKELFNRLRGADFNQSRPRETLPRVSLKKIDFLIALRAALFTMILDFHRSGRANLAA
jgi:hypothetical protein